MNLSDFSSKVSLVRIWVSTECHCDSTRHASRTKLNKLSHLKAFFSSLCSSQPCLPLPLLQKST